MTREERLEYIKVEVFKQTNQKLEDIELAMILGSIIATENIEESVEKVNAKFKGSFTQNVYNDLNRMTNWKLFLFKWGGVLCIIVGLLLIGFIINGYNIYQESKLPAEYTYIKQLDDGRYYIHKDDYTVVNKGIRIKKP